MVAFIAQGYPAQQNYQKARAFAFVSRDVNTEREFDGADGNLGSRMGIAVELPTFWKCRSAFFHRDVACAFVASFFSLYGNVRLKFVSSSIRSLPNRRLSSFQRHHLSKRERVLFGVHTQAYAKFFETSR